MYVALICTALSNNAYAVDSTWTKIENTAGNIAGTLLVLRVAAPIFFAHVVGLRLS